MIRSQVLTRKSYDGKCAEVTEMGDTAAENTFWKSHPTAKNPKLNERSYRSQQTAKVREEANYTNA